MHIPFNTLVIGGRLIFSFLPITAIYLFIFIFPTISFYKISPSFSQYHSVTIIDNIGNKIRASVWNYCYIYVLNDWLFTFSILACLLMPHSAQTLILKPYCCSVRARVGYEIGFDQSTHPPNRLLDLFYSECKLSLAQLVSPSVALPTNWKQYSCNSKFCSYQLLPPTPHFWGPTCKFG